MPTFPDLNYCPKIELSELYEIYPEQSVVDLHEFLRAADNGVGAIANMGQHWSCPYFIANLVKFYRSDFGDLAALQLADEVVVITPARNPTSWAAYYKPYMRYPYINRVKSIEEGPVGWLIQ